MVIETEKGAPVRILTEEFTGSIAGVACYGNGEISSFLGSDFTDRVCNGNLDYIPFNAIILCNRMVKLKEILKDENLSSDNIANAMLDFYRDTMRNGHKELDESENFESIMKSLVWGYETLKNMEEDYTSSRKLIK